MAEPAGLDALRAQVRAIEGGGVDLGRAVASLGQPVDAGLPWDGLPYRALHEVSGLAATSAVAAFARRFLSRGGARGWCCAPSPIPPSPAGGQNRSRRRTGSSGA